MLTANSATSAISKVNKPAIAHLISALLGIFKLVPFCRGKSHPKLKIGVFHGWFQAEKLCWVMGTQVAKRMTR